MPLGERQSHKSPIHRHPPCRHPLFSISFLRLFRQFPAELCLLIGRIRCRFDSESHCCVNCCPCCCSSCCICCCYLSFAVQSAQIWDTLHFIKSPVIVIVTGISIVILIVRDQGSSGKITNWVSLHLSESCVRQIFWHCQPLGACLVSQTEIPPRFDPS